MNETQKLSREEIGRYSRHLTLEQIGLKGQERLKSSKVLCIGAGGLGSPVLMYLSAAGIGQIGIVDFDVVDESNLHRQVIHSTRSVEKSKGCSAAERIAEINPTVQVELFETTLDTSNALDIIRSYDVIVDGTDNFPTRYLINDACEILDKPYVYGSIFKFDGTASVFNYKNGPTYRDLHPTPPPIDTIPNCAESGVLGVLPGIIGVIQATETIKILLGIGTTLSGRLLTYDALDMEFRELNLKKRKHAQPIKKLIDYHEFCGHSKAETSIISDAISTIPPTEARQKMIEGWRPFILDVRRSVESDIVQLPETDQQHPHSDLASILATLPKDRDILVYCKGGSRSKLACAELSNAGLVRVFDLQGGILEWARLVDPQMATY